MQSSTHPNRYLTPGNLTIERRVRAADYLRASSELAAQLDERRGLLFTSSFEYPGRYTRWDLGFVDPPVMLTAQNRTLTVEALNERGEVVLPALRAGLESLPETADIEEPHARRVVGRARDPSGRFHEEARSKQPSIFSLLRGLLAAFQCADEPYLGLYGAFGYELTYQFDPIRLRRPRDADQRDLVLYLPDEILVVDHRKVDATVYRYEFEFEGRSTDGLEHSTCATPFSAASSVPAECDHAPGEYADTVRVARERFRRGDLFEVVPGQVFFEPCRCPPSELFDRLKRRNPAPYGALVNLGGQEYLVAASPEMYVRVEGRRIETCPISGTIARGADAIEDATRIFELLSSEKETSELTMCTDVDRNDKSRVCVPGSVRVIGRRQIEMYSRLIHTVDHVEGTLREGFDALDGFLAHTWAVTVTGAPKHAAIQFIEDHERSPRAWYGGAIGAIGFNGDMNTGLTLRTVRIREGVAEVRAGATLLYDSDPDAEEAETRLKASALLDAIRRPDAPPSSRAPTISDPVGTGLRILMVDHQDSFVHTLAGYLRETGAEVVTLRSGFESEVLGEEAPDLVVLSPGPGVPSDFGLASTIGAVLERELPLFGVCLGLQGIVEHFGGRLATLEYPMHGKPSEVRNEGGRLLAGLPERFTVGRYHSLYGDPRAIPECLQVTARTEDGVVMAVEHRSRPVFAVQFHPESILSLEGRIGHALIEKMVRLVRTESVERRAPALSPAPG